MQGAGQAKFAKEQLKATKAFLINDQSIYAKALVVRSSVTGAAKLAMSLAEDLVACSELRATLWPPDREAQP